MVDFPNTHIETHVQDTITDFRTVLLRLLCATSIIIAMHFSYKGHISNNNTEFFQWCINYFMYSPHLKL